MRNSIELLVVFAGCQLIGCASTRHPDLAHYSFPEAQEEIREVIQSMEDASTSGDVKTLAAHHLKTEKFTRFGEDKFERVGYDECIAIETAAFSNMRDLVWDMHGLKIDVFGDVAVVTVMPEFSLTWNGEAVKGANRLTLVFLKTQEGWKIIHEHGTPKTCFEPKQPPRGKGAEE
jgi:ketosteroid isomerase-like protein